jgi:spore germination protein (amino acid permease)
MKASMERKMSVKKSELLEDSEGISIIVGFMIGISILTIPNEVQRFVKQDAWMTAIIGGIYPLIISTISTYYVKKHPNENILVLSKKYLGKILGNICNILFMISFIVHFTSVATGLSNVLIVHATSFLTPLKIYIPCVLLALYLSDMGVKVLGRINNIALLLVIILAMSAIFVLRRGTIFNILPLCGSGYKNILKGSVYCSYVYGGIEDITLKATAISIILYSWMIFLCIYYLGYTVTAKNLWPALLVTESINLPIINSIRFPFLFLWIMVALKSLSNHFYSIIFILSNTLKKSNITKFYSDICILLFLLCLMIENETQRRAILDRIAPITTIFNILYITLIALLIFINDKLKGTKQKKV